MLEDLGPSLDGGDVSLDARVSAASKGVWEEQNDGADVFNTSDNSAPLNISDSFFSILDEGINIRHASVQLIEVLVARKAVDKTGGEVGNGVERRECQGICVRRAQEFGNRDRILVFKELLDGDVIGFLEEFCH
jgi:hypothetical protein